MDIYVMERHRQKIVDIYCEYIPTSLRVVLLTGTNGLIIAFILERR
jgi:hypothetical protein